MKKIIKQDQFSWINIRKPNQQDINYLKEKFNIHPLVLDELINPGLRPKVESHKDYIFMILYYPVYDPEKRITKPRELNIIVTKNTLITSHDKSIPPVKNLFRSCQMNQKARETYMAEGIGQLLYYVLSAFWNNCLNKIKKIDQKINQIENDIFSDNERKMVLEISFVKTDIINFWRIIEPQNEILDSLLKEGLEFFGQDLSPYFSDLSGIYEQILNSLESYKEVILALHDTNQSLLSTRINDIMKVLTIFSVILLPLTLISSIWGMNFPNSLPLTNSTSGFWIAFFAMIIVALTMILFFRKKKWL